MKIRRSVIAAVSSAALAGAVLVPVLTVSGSSAAVTQDQITYVQQKSGGGSYVKYTGHDGTVATQNLASGGGGCSSPTISGQPLLPFSASIYGAGYTSPTAASVGAYNLRTGVCGIPQAWSVEVHEGLQFSIGQTNNLTKGRVFTQASIVLEREDKATAASPPVKGSLVMRRNGSDVGSAPFTISGASGTAIVAQTGAVSTGFDQVEVRLDDGPGSLSTASVSVVGPVSIGGTTVTSTFTLNPQICAGDPPLNATQGTGSDVQSSLSVSAGCKGYIDFSTAISGSAKSVNFSTAGAGTATITAHMDWGNVPYCEPNAAASPPRCAPTRVTFDGSTYEDQTFCDVANPPTTRPWCTTKVTYTFPMVNGVKYTHIQEDWSGQGDPNFAR